MPLPENHPLLAGLTEPQRQAVTHVDGPLLVLAGPGSGKTRVITHRIGFLIQAVGIAPWNILAITFTNKAAGEMRGRVVDLLGDRRGNAVTVSTFHSLCARLLRSYGDRIGLRLDYSIYDSADQQRAMKQALTELDISTSNFSPARVLATISNAKNELLDAEAFAQQAGDFYTRIVARAYTKYQQVMTRSNAMDFDDLLLKTVQLLRKDADVLRLLQEKYQYVQIDEYQDTNHVQFLLANALAGGHGNLCATGDPDQSIYGWRGANIQNILEFEQHYPSATVVRLEQNYRSTKRILAAADMVIQNNRNRRHKTLWTENEEGDPVQIAQLGDAHAEAAFVVEQFEQQQRRLDLPWSAFAVFYRTNNLSRVMEDALRQANIPYQIARGTSFYERKEVKDALAYLRAIANPVDDVNLLRIINTPPRRISDKTVKAMQGFAASQGMSAYHAIERIDQIAVLKPPAMEAVRKFGQMLTGWRRLAGLEHEHSLLAPAPDTIALPELVDRAMAESGLKDHYQKDTAEADTDRVGNIGELVSAAQQYENELALAIQADESPDAEPWTLAMKLYGYLERISLVSDVDAVDNGSGAVTLMTLHAAKGLEYPVVAMIGVEDGILPHERSQEAGDIEEERRLCFVGITRAMRRLYMTHTRFRTVFGQTSPAVPSPFLRELPQDQIERVTVDEDFGDERHPSTSPDSYPPGTLVRHEFFGLGRVLGSSRSAGQTRIKVEFVGGSVKTLILEYAPLTRVSA